MEAPYLEGLKGMAGFPTNQIPRYNNIQQDHHDNIPVGHHFVTYEHFCTVKEKSILAKEIIFAALLYMFSFSEVTLTQTGNTFSDRVHFQ